MVVDAQVIIHGSKAETWTAITAIERAAEIVTGIERIEVLHRPISGLVGLRWRETRLYFGKPEAVEKWITAATEGESYTTRAERDGFVFLSTYRISESALGIVLTSSHETRAQGLVAALKASPMILFRGVLKKALLQDLNDIKAAVERK